MLEKVKEKRVSSRREYLKYQIQVRVNEAKTKPLDFGNKLICDLGKNCFNKRKDRLQAAEEWVGEELEAVFQRMGMREQRKLFERV